MPKNNPYYIPKENYKKVEEVREIENEIPSYEEFLENYNQEQVNYDDLTHENISLDRGYGPCNWNNPRCSCRYGERWTNLIMTCPAVECRSRAPAYWFHSNNGYLLATDQTTGCGDLEISNKGRIQCKNCGIASSISNWSFDCGNHCGVYTRVSRESFLSSLPRVLMMYNDSNSRNVIRELIQYLMNNNY